MSSQGNKSPLLDTPLVDGVAIIGMGGRFPGAGSVAEFWKNQLAGVESISHFTVEELEIPNAAATASHPNYVRAHSVLEGADLFDPEFFGIYPREAELMDPQHRLFLECCWVALEDAGYDPFAYAGAIGVFGGASHATYFLSRLCADPEFIRRFTSGYQLENFAEMMGNQMDFLATRVSYKLNLRGPAFGMVSGCSTSLVAVSQACQSLLTYQSDMALAGGASITFPQKRGYHYQEGGMGSADGRCRTFDADAQGTVFGSGVATVLLKRMEDAVRDGDQIYAVIRGFAVNNDGSAKVGYTAPSVEGQARVIALAHEAAGIDPNTIGYVEAHGTGTPLGDPIELAALNQAFRARSNRNRFCAVGTVKTNIGHLDVAAGVTGLIHAAHIVRDGVFPPTLNFTKPNPKFDLENSPFYVNAQRAEWKSSGSPRRAGVSAFGVGGTNAHVILEQAPDRPSIPSAKPAQLLILSARTEVALDRATNNLLEHLKASPNQSLADAAWTLQVGRRNFGCRRSVVASNTAEAVTALTQRDRKRVQSRLRPVEKPAVFFLFPGQGSQHANMAREVYQTEPVFRAAVDRCTEILLPLMGGDLRSLLYPPDGASDEAKRRVTDTVIAQPAIFTIEYALAQLWMSWGIQPQAMLGHSIGEFVAACLAGVFSLEDALKLVATRGKLMQVLPAGGMLSVRLPEAEVRARLNGHPSLSLAAVNSPALCVVAGPFDALDTFENKLAGEGAICRRLVTSHAFHSAMMDPILEPFTKCVQEISLHIPSTPYVSSVTGAWITDQQATDPAYWSRHFRQPVQFSAAITELRKNPAAVLLEVGPGNVLGQLARQHSGFHADHLIVSSLSDGHSGQGDAASLMNALGALWTAGVQPRWAELHLGERRQRISLPTYPFERKRYWLENKSTEATPESRPSATIQESQLSRLSPTLTEEKEVSHPQSAIAPIPVKRSAKIRTQLLELIEELSGMDVSQADGSATFLEMGFDSLFLTQVTQALQARFGMKILFRQLMGEQSTLDALSAYLDGKLPAVALAEPATASIAVVSPAAVPAHSAPTQFSIPSTNGHGDHALSESSLERLMREQLQAMNQVFANQLETFRGTTAGAATTSSAPVPPAFAPARITPTLVANPIAATAKPETIPVPVEKEFKPFGPYKPIQKATSGGLTTQQEQGLRRLIEFYTSRTQRSKQMTEEKRRWLADPRVVSGFRREWKEMVYPIITTRSKGSRLWDVDGNEYIDILNGFGPIMLGHRPDFVEKAIEQQLHEGFEIGPQTPLAGEVAQMFCEMTGNERMTFCNTGSEAVMAALRVARTVTGRNQVALFAGAYHGMFDEVLVKGFKRAGAPQSAPIAPGIPREKVAHVTVLDYGTPEALDWIRQNAKDLAAVLVEPVQSRHPNLQPAEFLKEIRQITQNSGAAMIMDEVVTGFRVHPGGCQALFDIRADLATYGKVVAGGMPIGVLAGKAEFMDALDGGAWQFGDESVPEVGVTFFAGTFVRHPLTLAAMKAVLLHFKEQGPALQEQLTARTTGLARTLNEFFEQQNVPTRIQSFGSVFYFSFPAEERFASLFYYFLRAKGIHILEGFPTFLTTTHSEADIEQIVRAFKESVAEMQQAGFFPAPERNGKDSVATVSASPAPQFATPAPMTEPQHEIFLAANLGDDASCSFNESFSIYLRGALDVEKLRDAVNTVIARHEALRATIDKNGSQLHFTSALKLETPLRDFSALNPEMRESELKQLLAQDARTPFDLTAGPLVRTELVKLQADHYMLLFTSHHIVCDGWSTNVLIDELSQLYTTGVQGPPDLPVKHLPAPLRFSEYASKQRREIDSAETAKVESYWLAQFKDIPAPLDLPVDRPRPSVKNYAGATYRARIDAEGYRQIKSMGSKKGCTLFATLLAGFQALLHRLANQNDIVAGVPAAGQSLLDDGRLVGHCVNFLPLRARFEESMTFAALLGQVKKTVLDAYEHQSYTYGTLVRKLSMPRDPSRLPLMEVQFNLERLGAGTEFGGLQATIDPNPKSAVNFDLFFNIVESDRGLMIDCDYNTGLFDESTIARWLGQFERLLLGAVANPDLPVDQLPLMTGEEVAALLGAWNPNPSKHPVTRTVHQTFEEHAARTPEAVAVVMGEQRMTYRELNERANQLARHLRKQGVRPDSLVAVCFERSLEMVMSFLAVLKAGGAYLPIDSSYPAEKLSAVLNDAAPAVLLTQDRLADSLPKHNAEAIRVDKDWALIALQPSDNLESAAGPDHVAYVIYTSGSTGKPKGVMVTHANVVRLLKATEPWFDFDENDVWTMFHSYAFDFSVWEIWGSLTTGGRLVLVPYWVTRSPQDFYNLLAQEKVTVLNQTPAAFYQVVQVEESGFVRPLALRYVIFGGEALNFANLRPWFKRHGDAHPKLVNMYGITETTVHVTYRPLTVADAERETRSLIGVPIPDLRLYLLDARQQPVPVGVAGEIYVGGDGVAKGYLNRPQLNAERFLADPFAGRPHARMYKSGDLGRFLNNGDLEYLGRSDDQVKIHGFRIELGEIEAALAQHPDVRQCAVIARKDRAGKDKDKDKDGPAENKLVAYIVPANGSTPDTAHVREYLQSKLPAHMIPYACVSMPALPLTVNGKVDRAKLPAPDLGVAARTREYVAPCTPQEKTLAGILAEVLHLERVGVTDNLFELGADSLHVFQITSRAMAAGLPVTPRLLLQQRTVSSVLSEMGKAQVTPRAQAPAIVPVARQKYRITR